MTPMPSRCTTVLPWALTALTTTAIAACHPTPTSPPLAPEVVEWYLGEKVRGSETVARGASLGVVRLDLEANTKPNQTQVPYPHSCAQSLRAFIPLPTRTGGWFGLDDRNVLLRYTGDGWSPVPVHSGVTVPQIWELLAVTRSGRRLELLVTVLDGELEELAMLTITRDTITRVQSPAPSALTDRRRALQSFDNGRCIDGVRDCLHLTATDEGLSLTREPILFDQRILLTTFEKDTVLDARYGDPNGTTINVLTTRGCTPADEPSPKPETAP